MFAGRLLHDLDRPDGSATAGGQRPAGIGEPHASPVPFQQANPQRALEVVDLLGDRALGQAQGGCRTRDVLVVGDRQEGPDLLDRERRLAHDRRY